MHNPGYLENPDEWPSFHNPLISDIADRLNETLPEDYAARVDVRCYVLHPRRQMLPDVAVQRKPARSTPSGRPAAAAVASRPIDPPLLLNAQPIEIREAGVNVLSLRGGQRVVTAIEVLSPTNKLSGSEGWKRYTREQREFAANRANLLEIDLLRGGTHLVLADRELLNAERHWDYVASLHRAGAGDELEAWAWTLRERMPVVAIPLEGDDEDVPLDLQSLLDHRYDAGAYRRTIDYSIDPIPPLRPDDAAWADNLMKEQGLRPSG